MTKLLILGVSAASGHGRVAQALEATARGRENAPTVVQLDAMQHLTSGFGKVYGDCASCLVNHRPGDRLHVHAASGETAPQALHQRLRRAIERLSSGALMRAIGKERPDVVVCTHFLPAELLMRETNRSRVGCPVWLQVTDYDLHDMWIVPGMAGYFASTEEMAYRMRALGLPAARIHVAGIPVGPAYAQPQSPELDRAACRARLGLVPGRPVVLLALDDPGQGGLAGIAASVLALPAECQVIAVAGHDEAAKATLDAMVRSGDGRLLAVGYTDDMQALMAAADLVVTRPGTLTVSECLALGRPMLLVAPISGQEAHNAHFPVEQGAAWLADDGLGLAYKITRLMSEPMQLAAMAAHSRRLGRPEAATAVLDRVLDRDPVRA